MALVGRAEELEITFRLICNVKLIKSNLTKMDSEARRGSIKGEAFSVKY